MVNILNITRNQKLSIRKPVLSIGKRRIIVTNFRDIKTKEVDINAEL